MLVVSLICVVIGMVALPVGMVLMIFKRTRKVGMRAFVISIPTLVVAGYLSGKGLNAKAVAEGWSNAQQRSAAKAKGVTSPAVWIESETARQQAALLETTAAAERSQQAQEAIRIAVAAADESRRQALSVPAAQSSFLAAVITARETYNAGGTEMQKGSSRPKRAKALGKILATRAVKDWVGKVSILTTNGDGKGVLKIDLGEDVYIGTWNNALSDTFDSTLIEADDPAYDIMIGLQVGDYVRFSGKLPGSTSDFVKESSVTLSGSMTEPAFIIRFSKLAKVALPATN